MESVDVLVAGIDSRMRERLCAALRKWRLSFADNSEEVVARIIGPPRRVILIWDLTSDGEFGLSTLHVVRMIAPSLPIVVLDEACDVPRGGRSLNMGNVVYLTKHFKQAALRAAVARCLRVWGTEGPSGEEGAGAPPEAFEHYLHESLAAKQIFEHLPVAALVVNEKKTVLAVNEEGRRLTGAVSGDVGKKTCRRLLNCKAAEGKCPLERALSRQCPVYRAEIPVSTSHGERTMIERISTFQEPTTGERRAVVVCADATGYVKRMHRLNYQAHVDHLTRVMSRGRFEEALSRCDRRVDRRKEASLFVMIDVDGLKRVNERDGHAAGDRLLRRLGNLLRKETRRGDLVGRLGGDEFGIHCSHITRLEARDMIRRLRAALDQDNGLHPDEPPLRIGMGVSFSGDGGKNLREEADIRLRRYKKRRRISGV